MSRKLLAIAVILISCAASAARAEEYFGVGFHVGGQQDVGNLSSYNPGFQTEPQVSYILGFAFKANYKYLFLRTGIDTAFAINDGEVLENSDAANDPVTKYRINYTGVPLFFGLNFPVQDTGHFYLGGGAAYFLGTGSVTHGGTKEDIEAAAYGFGFIAGIQLNLTAAVRLYMEWEYLDARSGAVLNTNSNETWKNMYIDFTGHRILLGLMYYVF